MRTTTKQPRKNGNDGVCGPHREVERAAMGAGSAASGEPAWVREVSSGVDGNAPLVLVADDNELNRAVAKALLARRGVRSDTAQDGREAVQMARETDYAAVFMDCQMPQLDGYDATRCIRASEGSRRVPIIACTAPAHPNDRAIALAAGMDDYLAKPLRTDELDTAIRRWIPQAGCEDR